MRFTTGVLSDAVVTDSMKELLASGLNPGMMDRNGRTALHAAAMLGQLELARFLFSKGADINARDREGRTPLMVSASLGGFDLFRGFANTSPWELFWTERLCDLDLPEARAGKVRGLTDWHDMLTAQRPVLRLLLEAGADTRVKDSEGRDALDHSALGGPTGFDRLLVGKATGGEQPRCDLELARSPEVRGLRLGMGLREVTARLRPSDVPEAEWCGRLSLEFDWADDLLGQRAPLPRELAGVRRIRLGFLDGRLAYFRVTYDPRDAPLKPEQFRSTLSSTFSMAGRWRRAGGEELWDQPHSIGCDGFTLISGYNVGPYVELHDTASLDELLRRRREARLRRLREEMEEKERRRRVFKP
ncbi:MAG: ankyrin repeat domain-containing protein [Acidobacteria bacterium]|nr:ankyrin repeat domain-containing protein [Acidobacteriota bacterium]